MHAVPPGFKKYKLHVATMAPAEWQVWYPASGGGDGWATSGLANRSWLAKPIQTRLAASLQGWAVLSHQAPARGRAGPGR